MSVLMLAAAGNSLRRPFLLYSFYRLAKYLPQQVCHALRRLDGGDHQQVAIHLRPVEVMSRAADKLRQKRPLGAPVALRRYHIETLQENDS